MDGRKNGLMKEGNKDRRKEERKEGRKGIMTYLRIR